MGTANKRSINSQFLGLRWLLSQALCAILRIVRASPSTDGEECSIVLERTMRRRCSGAKARTGVRTCPHVADGICEVRCVNISILENNGLCNRVTRQSSSPYLKAIERSRE